MLLVLIFRDTLMRDTLMRLWEKRTEIENEIMKKQNRRNKMKEN